MGQSVTFFYVNHRGEGRQRKVTPIKLWFGVTQWHPTPQWFVKAIDLALVSKDDASITVERDFALIDIVGWQPLQ